MSATILIIEDEPAIADNIIYALKTDGYTPIWKSLGQEAVAETKRTHIDLIILDIGLPDASGFEICKTLRSFTGVPIIFLTARAEEIDRIVGLEIGADDYVIKPFSPRELVARVRAILRRTRDKAPSAPAIDSFIVDDMRSSIRYHQHTLELTRYEYLLLKELLSQPERVFTRAQLMDRVWPPPQASLDRSVDAHVKSIRAKLRAIDSSYDPIQTHRGFGYSISNKPI